MIGKIAHPNRRTRSEGFTLLEVTISVAIVFLILGVLAAIYPALTSASVETSLMLNAQIENDKARLILSEDLQMTDSTRSDPTGVPYFRIVDHAPGTRNSVILRRAEGYDVDASADMVTTRFGTPIEYFVNDQRQLIRRQDGADRVVANSVQGISFSTDIQGRITFAITTRYRQDAYVREVRTGLQLTPRNVLKI